MKKKKLILVSSCSILIFAFFIWYFLPILVFQWYYYKFKNFHKYLYIKPVHISELKNPPKKWENVTIEKLSMKLPLSEYDEVSGERNCIRFKSKNGSVHSIYFLVTENPTLSYQDLLETLKSLPDDISLFHSRSKNMTALEHQVGKIMSVPVGGLSKIISVQDQDLKALCMLSEKWENGYSAHTLIYDQNEAEIFSLMFFNYKNPRNLETDLLAMIGGIKTLNFLNDMDRVNEDISNLVNRFKNIT